MKLLTPPEPKIELYKEGFSSEKDLLGREDTGRALSDLVEQMDEPMVIALDGGWGEGKSFFLKCWVGAHTLQNEGKAKTIYFDAFEHDFSDEPLASLLGIILEQLGNDQPHPPISKAIKKIKTAALPLTRIGLAVASYGATEAGGALFDALTKQTGAELEKAAEVFWKKEDGRRTAMVHFKQALVDLTLPKEDGTPTQKLVIVIDELDRCRPDYALSLLEIIKHFFAVSGVHFVLGVNMRGLENSVKARYGAGIDAGLYLQKFVTLRMGLSKIGRIRRNEALRYFEKTSEAMKVNYCLIHAVQLALLKWRVESDLTLRSLQRLIQHMALLPTVPEIYDDLEYDQQLIIASLLVIRTFAPNVFITLQNGAADLAIIVELIDLNSGELKSSDRRKIGLREAWNRVLKMGPLGAGFAPQEGTAWGKPAPEIVERVI